MRMFLALALVATLPACTALTPPPAPVAPTEHSATPIVDRVHDTVDRADAAVARAEAAYARISGRVDLVLPVLPESVAGPARRARVLAEQALVTLRTAVSVAQRKAALDDLERAARDLVAIAR